MRQFMLASLAVFFTMNVFTGSGFADETKHKVHASERAKTELRPYDSKIDAMKAVDEALARATLNNTKALIVMGANWCHDSRALATRFDTAEFKTLISQKYELVYVSAGTNPGQNNENKAVSKRFGVESIEGTPTVFIATPNGDVLNADSAVYWRNAHEIPSDMTLAYLEHYALK
ncbi:MAG: protein-disulfide isomerase [Robiginitomaculum sp.]|nr:MAG: protein-disulfide isomerase [Robiginitomaculum sp.]